MGSFGTYVQSLIGTYTPSGDNFGGADWGYIIRGILLIMFVYWTFKFISYLIKKI